MQKRQLDVARRRHAGRIDDALRLDVNLARSAPRPIGDAGVAIHGLDVREAAGLDRQVALLHEAVELLGDGGRGAVAVNIPPAAGMPQEAPLFDERQPLPERRGGGAERIEHVLPGGAFGTRRLRLPPIRRSNRSTDPLSSSVSAGNGQGVEGTWVLGNRPWREMAMTGPAKPLAQSCMVTSTVVRPQNQSMTTGLPGSRSSLRRSLQGSSK